MFEDIVKLCQHFSIGDFTSRELIRKRMDEGKRVALHEVLYPVMQGYDSYFMNTDIQIGGTDQTFNMQAGRTLQKDLREKESFVLATEFLPGTDGKKMSKTGGNAIWLDENPNDMFAKVMAINDDVILTYYTLGTNTKAEEIEKIKKQLENGENPMKIKKELAKHIVTELHSKNDAQKAQENFEKTVQQRELPTEILEVTVAENVSINEALLVELGLAESKSEAKRLFQQHGVEVDGKKIETETKKITSGMILKVGKRNIRKIRHA